MRPILFCTLSCFLGLIVVFSAETLSAKSQCPKSKKTPAQKEAEMIKSAQKQMRNNVRSLGVFLDDKEWRQKINVSEEQDKKLDVLNQRYIAAREKVEKTQFPYNATPDQLKMLGKMKREKLDGLSLQAGISVTEILTEGQINAYGRYVEMEKLKNKKK